MHFSGTTADDIKGWIDEKNNGNDTNYRYCKEDTQEAMLLLYKMPYFPNNDYASIRDWFVNSLQMRTSSSSCYRAFIVIKKDEIFNLRLSRHYSTKNATFTIDKLTQIKQ